MGCWISAACGCDRGKVRSNNEDNFYFDGRCLPERNGGLQEVLTLRRRPGKGMLLAVFDGMGGEACGETASYTAAVSAHSAPPRPWRQRAQVYLDGLVRSLSLAVFASGQERLAQHMGTTMAGLYALGRRAYAVNVGDSRIYLLRGGVLEQLSVDDTDAVLAGQSLRRKPRLTQHLGIDPSELCIEPHILPLALQRGDRYLLCSDGLTDLVEPPQLARLLQADTPSRCVQGLIDAALEAGGRDNITALVAVVE